MKNTWQPITPEIPIKEGDIVGGYNPTGRWLQVRVTSYMVNEQCLTIGRMIPTHWTDSVPFFEVPKRPKVEDCKVMELTF